MGNTAWWPYPAPVEGERVLETEIITENEILDVVGTSSMRKMVAVICGY